MIVVCDRMPRTCPVVYCDRMSVLWSWLLYATECLGPVRLCIVTECQYCTWSWLLYVTECLGHVLLYIVAECQYYGHDCCLWQNARRLLWPVPLSIVTECQYCCLDCCMWQSARTITRSSIVVYCDRMSVLWPWLLFVAKCPKVTRTCTVAYCDRMSVLWSWLLYVTECQDGYYGQDCSTSCSCTAANTASCDHVTGTCSCKAGWEGSTCSSDVNECLRRQHDCTGAYEECVNDVGGYHCVCAAGYYYKYFRVCQGMCVHTRSGELRTQKIKVPSGENRELKRFPF